MCKTRTGFVSNSSSSSYMCAVCGDDRGGGDWLEEGDKYICNRDEHAMCMDHIRYALDGTSAVLHETAAASYARCFDFVRLAYDGTTCSLIELDDGSYSSPSAITESEQLLADHIATSSARIITEVWYDSPLEICELIMSYICLSEQEFVEKARACFHKLEIFRRSRCPICAGLMGASYDSHVEYDGCDPIFPD